MKSICDSCRRDIDPVALGDVEKHSLLAALAYGQRVAVFVIAECQCAWDACECDLIFIAGF